MSARLNIRGAVRPFLGFCLLLGCGDGAPRTASSNPVAPRTEAQSVSPGGSLPAPDHNDSYLEAHLQRHLVGDLKRATALLQGVSASSTAPRALRATALLRLAEMALIRGQRRRALAFLDQAREAAGTGHPLAMAADDRRARILAATPLANVRGPVPGSVQLTGESRIVMARFGRAERQLATYHGVVVAPTLENINTILRIKRKALAAAVAAYQKVAEGGGPAARAAAHFRMGATHHNLAEALAFELPTELLPSVAARLRRRLRKESTSHLRRSLTSYRKAAGIEGTPATAPWRELAAREVKTLSRILK